MSGPEEKKLAVTAHDVEVESESEGEVKPSANFLSISRPSPSRQTTPCVLSTIHDVDSAHTVSLPPTPSYEKSIETTFAYTVSRDRNDMYSDLEAQGLTEQKTGTSKSGLITQRCSKIDSAWPGRNHIKQQRKAQKLQRAQCACWARLSKLCKSLIVTVIVLAVLGIALGLGFGLSQKVGGTSSVWYIPRHVHHNHNPIGPSSLLLVLDRPTPGAIRASSSASPTSLLLYMVVGGA
ncbi:hypothetical protein LZ554_009329 [Drepanopeziza brunnea f. sp. 'monogermtubi']|nr:hypothetical protein LZ554_009329 [Drepanopeziza brunnea f. sp. 'monogermtubi']